MVRMKVYCNIDLDGRKFEGRTQLTGQIMEYLQKRGHSFTSNPAEAELIHLHISGVFDYYLAYKLKKRYKVPVVYSLYSNSQTSLFWHPLNFLIQKIYFQKTATKFLPSYSAALPLRWRGYFLKKMNVVIVPSQYLQKKMFSNTAVIPFGIDTEKYRPLDLKRNKKNGIVKVAYFGHPGVFKGLNDFVNASKKFGKEIETHLFLTQRFDKVDGYVRQRNPLAIIHGFVEDMVKAYHEMDIIVLPYRMEIGTVANPLVLLESMACGKAIITADHDFVREIVQDSAVIVKKNSPDSIAAAVQKLAQDYSLREQLGKRAREMALEKHDLKQMLEKYHQLYQNYEESIPIPQ